MAVHLEQEAGWELLHEGSDWSNVASDPEAAAAIAPTGRFGMASAVSVGSGGEADAGAGGMDDALLVFGGWTLEWPGE